MNQLFVASIQPGCLIEFMQGDQPQLAWILSNTQKQYRALSINKREIKLTLPRILPWIGPCFDPQASRQEILTTLNEHHIKRGELQASIDIMDVWELAQGEMPLADIAWFTELLWSDADADKQAAMGRALLLAKSYFKFRPPHFEIRTKEIVESRLLQEQKAQEREQIITVGNELFRSLWFQKTPPESLNLDNNITQSLKNLLLEKIQGKDEQTAILWTACKKGLPEHPHQALLLAKAWGILKTHHNHLLDETGYIFEDSDWTPQFAKEIETQTQKFKAAFQEAEQTPFISIDGASTRDIDDAFYIQKDAQGYTLSIALARPSLTWEFGTALDKEVLSRGTSLYLPEGTSHMLPEELGLQLYSLQEGTSKPALVLDMRLDHDAHLLSISPRLAWICVQNNLTYTQAEKILHDAENTPLSLASELASKLLKRRLEKGASIIIRPDLDIVLEETEDSTKVSIAEKTPTPKSSLLVSEFMILSTSAIASWCKERDIPMLSRSQDIALPSDAQGIFHKPEEIFRVVKLLAPAILEAKFKRHAALGATAYTPVTSPIRRYTDLVNMMQIQSTIETGQAFFEQTALENLVPMLSSRLGRVGQIQRFRPRYWKLLYLAQNKKQQFEAIALEENGQYPTLAIPSLQINVRTPRTLLGDKIYIGQQFLIRIAKVDPLLGDIKIAEALEM